MCSSYCIGTSGIHVSQADGILDAFKRKLAKLGKNMSCGYYI